MTARASSLIDRVNPPRRDANDAWTMPAQDLRTFLNAFARLGFDPDNLLASAGIAATNANDPDARIPCEYLGRIVSSAQRQRFTRNLAIELARVTPLGAYPLLDYLVMTSDTVGEGIRQLARYFRLVGNPVVLVIQEGSPNRVEMTSAEPFGCEFVATLMVLHLRNETDGRFTAEAVSVTHGPDDAETWQRLLGCPVHPRAPWNGISVSRTCWELPLRRRDAVLRQILEARADDVLSRLPKRIGLALEVQRALAPRIAGGDTRVESLARQLAMSRRTLQRRLAAEGVSYQELLDDMRKEASARYITESRLAVCEIAYLLGYSEPAAFHRAFRRWHATTPEAFRRRDRPER